MDNDSEVQEALGRAGTNLLLVLLISTYWLSVSSLNDESNRTASEMEVITVASGPVGSW